MNNIEAKNYIDESTTEFYKFVFRCDCCNKIVSEYSCKNPNYFKPKLFSLSAKQKENERLWIKGHDEALRHAKLQALERLNRCEICGKLICDDCVIVSENLDGGICCKNCSMKK